MKRYLLVLALIFSFLSAPSLAAVTAGSKCTKLGKIIRYNNSEFKCVKKKQALVWQKTKTITVASPTISPTPVPSPTPISTPAPSPIPITLPSPEEKIKRPTTFQELDAKTSWRFVYEELQSRLKSQKTGVRPIKYEYIYGATVNKAGARLIQEINQVGLTFFSDIFNPDEPIIEFYGTELDEQEWKSILNRIDGNLNRWFYVTNGKQDPRSIFGAAGKGYVLYMIGSKATVRAEDFMLFVVHETAHIIQNHMTPNGEAVQVSHDSSGNVTSSVITLPLLFLEGHADFIGYNVGFPSAEQSRLALQRRAPKSTSGVPEYPLMNTRDVVSFFETWEDPKYVYKRLSNGKYERDSYAIYYYGNIALTGLTAIKGYEPLHQFFLKVKAGVPYRKAFEESYGMTLSEFYAQIAPYVIETVKELAQS